MFYRYLVFEPVERAVEWNRGASCRARGCSSVSQIDDPFCVRCRQEIDALREMASQMTSQPLSLFGRSSLLRRRVP
jgi:hypothetical protein